MPGGDRTGPWGMGPMTGRGAGYCAGYAVPGFMNPGPGMGRGWGRGPGRGWGCGWGYRYMHAPAGCYFPPAVYPVYGGEAAAADEKKFLNDQVEFLENQLKQVKKRLEELADDNDDK